MTMLPVLACLPVDDEKNRAYLESLGVTDMAWPAPIPGSVRAHCENCEGQVWIGPEMLDQRTSFEETAVAYRTFCIVCAAAMDAAGHVDGVIELPGQEGQ
jgi:hypothetical protein